MFQKILVAVDGSEHGYKAAQLAAQLAHTLSASLRVITVYEPLPEYLGEPEFQKAINKRMVHAQEILERTIQAIGAMHKDIKTEMLEGPVAEAILAVAEVRKVDLIVMGTRGLGRLTGLLLGSQSQKVVQHAPCPVLLVR